MYPTICMSTCTEAYAQRWLDRMYIGLKRTNQLGKIYMRPQGVWFYICMHKIFPIPGTSQISSNSDIHCIVLWWFHFGFFSLVLERVQVTDRLFDNIFTCLCNQVWWFIYLDSCGRHVPALNSVGEAWVNHFSDNKLYVCNEKNKFYHNHWGKF